MSTAIIACLLAASSPKEYALNCTKLNLMHFMIAAEEERKCWQYTTYRILLTPVCFCCVRGYHKPFNKCSANYSSDWTSPYHIWWHAANCAKSNLVYFILQNGHSLCLNLLIYTNQYNSSSLLCWPNFALASAICLKYIACLCLSVWLRGCIFLCK